MKKDIKLMRQGEPVDIVDLTLHRKWVVHPFLFRIKDPVKIKIDWEHTETRWINPDSLGRYKTVPGLKRAFDTIRSS